MRFKFLIRELRKKNLNTLYIIFYSFFNKEYKHLIKLKLYFSNWSCWVVNKEIELGIYRGKGR